jgi:acyl-CoA thioesterase-1
MFFGKVNPRVKNFKIFPVLLFVTGFVLAGCNAGTDYEPLETLVCFGDSLTSGYGTSVPGKDDKTKSYPEYLREKVAIPVVNAGRYGKTTGEALARIETEVLSENPWIVIIELGANDLHHKILADKNVPFAEILTTVTDIFENLDKIIKKLNRGGRKIYVAKFYNDPIAREVASEFGLSNKAQQDLLIKSFDSKFEDLAEKNNNIEIIDGIWDGVWGEHMSDAYHPDGEGCKIMAENYFKAIRPYLEEHNLLTNE